MDADDLPLLVADDGHEVEGGNFTHSGMLGVWLKVIYRVTMVLLTSLWSFHCLPDSASAGENWA